jgi:hypothetical protein
MDRRRGGFASEARRLYSADTHVCASARYKNATLKLQSALRDHATFAAYLAEQTARRTSQLFGHAFLSGYAQLGGRGVELVRRLAARGLGSWRAPLRECGAQIRVLRCTR